MKVVFAYPIFENLGIEYLSAALKKERHSTELAYDPSLFDDDARFNSFLSKVFNYKSHIVDRIVNSRADLLCFSVVSDRYPWACEIASRVRERTKVPIVFGGMHPTSDPEDVISNDFVDYVVVGEGEGAIVDLAKCLQEKKDASQIKNLWLKKDGRIIKNEPRSLIEDLDSLPFPDKDLYSKEFTDFQGQHTVITSRGCQFSCTYCCNNYLKRLYHGNGKYRRMRSVENVIEELKLAKERNRINSVLFFDEELFFETERAKRLLELYKKEINLPYWCYINPQLMDEEKLDLLEKTGCSEVEMGVQDLDPSVNKNILRRSLDVTHLKQVIKRMHKAKIIIQADIMLGLPTQKEKNVLDMVNFFNENRIDYPMVFWMRYYPKTDMIDIALKEGALEKGELNRLGDSCAFYVKGSTYNPRFAKIANLYYLSCLLPSGMIKFIINKKLYSFFPPVVLKYFFNTYIINKIALQVVFKYRKRGIFFVSRLPIYTYYFLKWLKIR